MTFYQELQLNSAGSKELIRQAQDKKEKWRHILIYNFKVYLVVAFCFAVVSIYSMIFGSDNSVAGVVVLLALMVLRQVDFGIKTSHGVGVIFLIFGILAAGPRLSNMLSPVPAFCVNVICILGIMVLGCHNVLMSNQSTFVLAYLLLQGYDVTGHSYMTRITGLALGAAVCALVFHIRHRGRVYKKKFLTSVQGIFLMLGKNTVVYPPDARRIFRNADRLAASYPSCHVGGNCLYVSPASICRGPEIPCQAPRTLLIYWAVPSFCCFTHSCPKHVCLYRTDRRYRRRLFRRLFVADGV